MSLRNRIPGMRLLNGAKAHPIGILLVQLGIGAVGSFLVARSAELAKVNAGGEVYPPGALEAAYESGRQDAADGAREAGYSEGYAAGLAVGEASTFVREPAPDIDVADQAVEQLHTQGDSE